MNETSNVKDALGYATIQVAATSSELNLPKLISNEIVREAKERGISVSKPSDALDQSRDIIIDDALQSLGRHYPHLAPFQWEIANETLRVTTVGIPLTAVVWPED